MQGHTLSTFGRDNEVLIAPSIWSSTSYLEPSSQMAKSQEHGVQLGYIVVWRHTTYTTNWNWVMHCDNKIIQICVLINHVYIVCIKLIVLKNTLSLGWHTKTYTLKLFISWWLQGSLLICAHDVQDLDVTSKIIRGIHTFIFMIRDFLDDNDNE